MEASGQDHVYVHEKTPSVKHGDLAHGLSMSFD